MAGTFSRLGLDYSCRPPDYLVHFHDTHVCISSNPHGLLILCICFGFRECYILRRDRHSLYSTMPPPGRSGHTKGVVNKAKTRDAEESNIVPILSRSDAT